MPQFQTHRPANHSADEMFALVADVEKYPEFLPLCEALTVKSRKERDARTLLIADMSVGYKAIRETFTTQVFLKPDEKVIEVKYIDGPFKYLSNTWRFEDRVEEGGGGRSEVEFFIDYEFKSRILGAVMGSMFDRAFRMFSEAFEKRADQIYGTNRAAGLSA